MFLSSCCCVEVVLVFSTVLSLEPDLDLDLCLLRMRASANKGSFGSILPLLLLKEKWRPVSCAPWVASGTDRGEMSGEVMSLNSVAGTLGGVPSSPTVGGRGSFSLSIQ